ncbi:hypothetical protein GQ53DRAFT_839682 [Thozetella sp. PMI_491]|nr:hypothetical protein GQ53DRAFT_839682 [Thozetella sp. PMI_491]
MPEYEFFVSSRVPGPADAAVRSHAIRTALKLRSRSAKELSGHSTYPGPETSRQIEQAKGKLKGRFRLNSVGELPRKGRKGTTTTDVGVFAGVGDGTNVADPSHRPKLQEHAVQVERFGNNAVDPFAALPAQNNTRIDTLVKYFLTRFNLNINTVDKERTWFSWAAADPLIMRATLSLAAAFWAAGAPNISPALQWEGLRQRTEAIREVNSQLAAQPAISDTLIATVATLCNAAAVEGNFHEAHMHIKAVERLVGLRGGALAFRDNFWVARAVTWTDIQTASGIGRRALFPLIDNLEGVHLADSLAYEACHPSLSHLGSIDTSAGSLQRIFLLLRQALLCKTYYTSAASKVRTVLNAAEIEILNHLHDHAAALEPKRFKIVLSATHVFLYVAMRQFPYSSPMVKVLLNRLKNALRITESDHGTWQEGDPALLWALFVGAAASHDATDEMGEWFSLRFRVMTSTLGVDYPQQIVDYIEKFIWDEGFGRPFLYKWLKVDNST